MAAAKKLIFCDFYLKFYVLTSFGEVFKVNSRRDSFQYRMRILKLLPHPSFSAVISSNCFTPTSSMPWSLFPVAIGLGYAAEQFSFFNDHRELA